MKYSKTIKIESESTLDSIKIGQWFTLNGTRGQYMGKTKGGHYVVRYAVRKFSTQCAIDNKHLRKYAVING